MFQTAIVRTPAETFDRGITTANLGRPDLAKMLRQHAAYVDALRCIGLDVIVLPPLPDFPDAHFVEDTAVVTPRVAVVTRPGAPARLGEEAHIAEELARFRIVERIEAPGTLDGGDVLMVGGRFFIGISARTNRAGAAQLGRILENAGHSWQIVAVDDGLHLKSSVNWVGGNRLVMTETFAGRPCFAGYEPILVETDERAACNTLWVNDHLIVPAGFPRTRERLAWMGLPLLELDMSETRKMDGGLTCLSIRF